MSALSRGIYARASKTPVRQFVADYETQIAPRSDHAVLLDPPPIVLVDGRRILVAPPR